MKLLDTLLEGFDDKKGERSARSTHKIAMDMAHVVSKRIGMAGIISKKDIPEAKKKATSEAKTLLADVERELFKMIEREIK